MCTLHPPFRGKSQRDLGQAIIKGRTNKLPEHYSETVVNLVKACLQRHIDSRPQLDTLLKVPAIEARVNMLLESKEYRDEFAKMLVYDKKSYEAFKKEEDIPKDKLIDLTGYTPP